MKKFLDELGDGVQSVVEAITTVAESARTRRWEQANARAQLIGLSADAKLHFVGERRGVPIRRRSVDHSGNNDTRDWWTHTKLTLSAPVPWHLSVRPKKFLDKIGEWVGVKDVELGIRLDSKIWVRFASQSLWHGKTLLTRPEVVAAMEAVDAEEIYFRINGSYVELRFRGRHLSAGDRGVDVGVALALALNAVMEEDWAALAEEGLRWKSEVYGLEGHLRGRALDVVCDGKETALTVWLPTPLPTETTIGRKDALKGTHGFDDAILDRMLHVHSDDVEAVRERLCTDEVRGRLLELVHGYPGSWLLTDRLEVRLQGFVGVGLRRYVDAAVDLAAEIG